MNLRCLPRTFHGKNGLAVELHHLPSDGGAQLIDMYLAFRPRNSFQGLPPLKDEVCVRWVQDMLRTGIHVTASSAASPIVGHCAIFPINRQKCEMLVVVWPGFQNLGIGTELVRSCIDVADELGYRADLAAGRRHQRPRPARLSKVRIRVRVKRAGPRARHGVRGPPPPPAPGRQRQESRRSRAAAVFSFS